MEIRDWNLARDTELGHDYESDGSENARIETTRAKEEPSEKNGGSSQRTGRKPCRPQKPRGGRIQGGQAAKSLRV